jgi:hypothetical protein
MHMVTSNHVYADELTVHGEHDCEDMDAARLEKREAWSAPNRTIAPGPARQASR